MRVVLGVIMVAHGYTKIIPSGALYTFTHMVTRMHLPLWLGYVAAFTEFFGGMLLVVGLLTRVAAFMTAVTWRSPLPRFTCTAASWAPTRLIFRWRCFRSP